MAAYALIKDGVVVNIHELADPNKWRVPVGHTNIPAGSARIGDLYDGQAFTTPARPEPEKSEADKLLDLLVTEKVISAQKAAAHRSKS
jgi:hypothetical protein